MPLNTGQVLQERYRIDALLGQGGMGAVYRGLDLRFNAPVAIKENQMVTPESQKQFAREAGLLYRLRHPNLPRVIDHFYLGGQGQYLVMDYIEGEDLRQLLARHGPLPGPQALDWIGQVLDALDYLHSQSIIHRDVKPANVKITPEGQVFLVDFGLAKVHDPLQQTTMGARGVTPGYAPPEQYGHGRTDARTDVYSAGATLYALLTGQTPPDALEYVTGQAHLVPPRQVNPRVSPGVEAAILRAMQTRPDDRFSTAGELRAELLEPPAGRPPEPTPEPPPQSTRLAEPGRRARIAELLPQAWAALNQADWEQAAAHASQVLDLEPQNTEAERLLQRARTAQQLERRYSEASAALEAGDWRQAEAALQEVVALDASYRDAQTQLDRARAETARQRRMADLRAEGEQALGTRDWETALARFKALLALEPDQPEIQAGIEQARQGIEANRQARAHFEEAQAHFEREEWAEAAQAAELSLSLRPDAADYAELVAQAQARLEAEERARRRAEQEAQEKEGRDRRLAVKFAQAERAIEYDPDRSLSLLSEIRQESARYPGLAGLRRKAQDAQLARSIREQEERQAQMRKLQKWGAIALGAVVLLVLIVSISGAIRNASLKKQAEEHNQAALTAFDAGQWAEGRAQLEQLAQIELEKLPIEEMLRAGYDHGLTQAIEAGAWEPAAELFLHRLKQGQGESGAAEELTRLLTDQPQLGRALEALTGMRLLGWQPETVQALQFSLDGENLITTSYGEARVWRVAEGLPLHTLDEGRRWAVSPDATLLASSASGTVKVWQAADGSLWRELQSHGASVDGMAFSPDGTWLAAGQGEVWRVADEEPVYTLPALETPTVPEDAAMPERTGRVAIAPDGTVLAQSSETKIGLWSLADGALLHTLTGHSSTMYWLAFSPDGATLASGAGDATVRLWRVADGTLLHTLKAQNTWERAAFSPDGRLLATISNAGEAQFWLISDGSLQRSLERDRGNVHSLAFSPDGEKLALLNGGDVELWRVSDGALLRTLDQVSPLYASQLAFGPDSKTLAVTSPVLRTYQIEGETVVEWDGSVVQLWSLDEASSQSPDSAVHVVKTGETLSSIAALYGTTIQAVLEANGLSGSSILRAGQQLIIPPPADQPAMPTPKSTGTRTPGPTATSRPTNTRTPEPTHTPRSTDVPKPTAHTQEMAPWPMYQHDTARSAASPYLGPDHPSLKWHYAIPENSSSSPSIGLDGTIYVGGNDNRIHAVNPGGTRRWTYTASSMIWGSPAVGEDGAVYIGHVDYDTGSLLALTPDGSLKWSYPARGVRSSPVVGADGMVYVGASNARLYAINPDGSLQWVCQEGFKESYSSPAIGSDGTIYIAGTKDRNIHAVNPNGTTRWTYPIGSSGDTMFTPTIGPNGTIYVGGSDDKLYALTPDGSMRWSANVGDVHNATQSAALGPDGTIYVVNSDGVLCALDPTTGTIEWTYASGAKESTIAPSVDASGVIYFAGRNGRIFAVRPDGTEKWVFQSPAARLLSSIAIGADGTLYVSGDEGLYAVGE